MKRYFVFLLFLLSVLTAKAYDFEVDGILYHITNRWKRTVEVTHWDEFTGINGIPDHYRPDPCLAHLHDSTHVHDEHCMHHDAVEHIPVVPEYPDTVVIPQKVRFRGISYKVTAIGDGSFYEQDNIRIVRLPQSVTRIGRSAFSRCGNLREVEWHAELQSIEDYAFFQDNSLETIVLPDSLTHLGVYAFAICLDLREVYMPAGLESFQGNAFLYCDRLKRIILSQTTPPTVLNTGIKMNFNNITFEIPEGLLPVYQQDKFWRNQKIK